MSFSLTGLLALAMGATSVTAQQAVHIDGDSISLRGCVTTPSAQLQMPIETLLWSRGGILAAATAIASGGVRADTQELASRILYWLDDDDLAEHAGKMVEVRGELGDLKKGEVEIDRDGDFTEIRLDLDGREETIRVPSSWLDTRSVARAAGNVRRDDDREIEIATRKIDVKDVKVLGACPVR